MAFPEPVEGNMDVIFYILLTDVTQRFREFPSWEGRGVGCDVCGVSPSATHPQPLPGGEFAVIRIESAA